MNAIHRWNYQCLDQSSQTINETIWSKDKPTQCKDGSHTLIDGSQTIVETISSNEVTAKEDSDGYFETTQVNFDIPTGTPGAISEHDISWPMNILMWRTILTPTADMVGDVITVMGSPETTVGTLTADGTIGDTILNVDSTVLDNTIRGFLITIDDTVNKDVLGRCVGVDKVNGTITVENGLSYNYLTGSPVKISVYIIKDIFITDTNTIDVGMKGFKGKMLSAGTILRIYYTNNSGTSKTFKWRVEYYNEG